MKELSNYIASLQSVPPPAPKPIAAQEERYTPLEHRLKLLIDRLTPEEIEAGLSLVELQSRLRGRYRPTCSTNQLGAALRAQGFERRRFWRDGRTSFCARWFRVAKEI